MSAADARTKDIALETQALELAQVMIREIDGTIRLWTRGMEKLYGYTREEAVGQMSHRLLRTIFPRPRDEIEAELRSRGQWSGELVHRRRDGATVVVASHWTLYRDGGRPAVVTEVNSDITEQKRSESARLYLAAIVDSSGDAIISKTPDGIVRSWNKAAQAIFGYSAEEMIGQPITRLFPPERLREEDMIIERIMRGERVDHYETVRRRKDGTEIHVSLSVSPIRDAAGTVVGVSKIVRDITEQKLAQARLQDLQSELLHVSRLSTMGQMASTLAHELNQPLTAVTNYLSALRRMTAGPGPGADPKRVEEILERTIEQATRAGQVIRRLREFVAKGETERGIESVNDMVENAVGLALVGARQQGISASMELGRGIPDVLVDRVQIQQVLINLVRNALEAMERSERRELRITTRYLHDTGQAEVTVADTGPGIAPEIASRLFQPFVSSKKTGMGLGLSICRDIVESHGGVLSVVAGEPNGTVFSMTLPVISEEQPAGDT
jgi:two-component system sensor kinase FixL